MLPDRDVRFTQPVYAAGPAFAEANVSSDSSTTCEVPVRQTDYSFTIHPLTAEEGGSHLIGFPACPAACRMARPSRKRSPTAPKLNAVGLRLCRRLAGAANDSPAADRATSKQRHLRHRRHPIRRHRELRAIQPLARLVQPPLLHRPGEPPQQ